MYPELEEQAAFFQILPFSIMAGTFCVTCYVGQTVLDLLLIKMIYCSAKTNLCRLKYSSDTN